MTIFLFSSFHRCFDCYFLVQVFIDPLLRSIRNRKSKYKYKQETVFDKYIENQSINDQHYMEIVELISFRWLFKHSLAKENILTIVNDSNIDVARFFVVVWRSKILLGWWKLQAIWSGRWPLSAPKHNKISSQSRWKTKKELEKIREESLKFFVH